MKIDLTEINKLIYSGILIKRGQLIKSWKKRYVELYCNRLIYYTKKNGKKKGEIEISSSTEYANSTLKPFCFLIRNPDRILYLRCKNINEKNIWEDYIFTIINSYIAKLSIRTSQENLKLHLYHDNNNNNNINNNNNNNNINENNNNNNNNDENHLNNNKIDLISNQNEDKIKILNNLNIQTNFNDKKIEITNHNTPYSININIIKANNLTAKDRSGTSDPFVIVKMGSSVVQTKTIPKNLDPIWNESFNFPFLRNSRYIRIEVWDEDQYGSDDFLGVCLIPILDLPPEKIIKKTYNLCKRSTKSHISGTIDIEIKTDCPLDNDILTLFHQVQSLPEFKLELNDMVKKHLSIPPSLFGLTYIERSISGENIEIPLPKFPQQMPPIESENLEDFALHVTLKSHTEKGGVYSHGLLILTNFRLIFVSDARLATGDDEIDIRYNAELTNQLPLGLIESVSLGQETNAFNLPISLRILRVQCKDSRIISFLFRGPHFGDAINDLIESSPPNIALKIPRALCTALGRSSQQLDPNSEEFIYNDKNINQEENENYNNIYNDNNLNNNKVFTIKDRKRSLTISTIESVHNIVDNIDNNENIENRHNSLDGGTKKRKSFLSIPNWNSRGRSKTATEIIGNFASKVFASGKAKALKGQKKFGFGGLNLTNFEIIDSDEGPPSKRLFSRLFLRTINKSFETSIAENINDNILKEINIALKETKNDYDEKKYIERKNSIDEINENKIFKTVKFSPSTNPSNDIYNNKNEIITKELVKQSVLNLRSRQGSFLSLENLHKNKNDINNYDINNIPRRKSLSDASLDVQIPNTPRENQNKLYSSMTHYGILLEIKEFLDIGWNIYNPIEEYNRLNIPDKNWRISSINQQYEICPTYPSLLVFPVKFSDDDIRNSHTFRSKGRLPVLVWRHPITYATISRSSQPLVGLQGATNEYDEKLLNIINTSSSIEYLELTKSIHHETTQNVIPFSDNNNNNNNNNIDEKQNIQSSTSSTKVARPYYIIDARPKINAQANKAAGKGVESRKNYKFCRILFMGIHNIHVIRKSFSNLLSLSSGTDSRDNQWLSDLESSGWLTHIQKILSATLKIIRLISMKGYSVLVHCSDGWDRTSQLCSLSELLMDPYFRTFKGFMILIEKEWCSFGHKFQDRTGMTNHLHEHSPIFQQFLDCVFQCINQYPNAFEFNEDMLLVLFEHSYTGWFGSFLYNCERERKNAKLSEKTISIWSYFLANEDIFKNKNYKKVEGNIIPIVSAKRLVIWHKWFLTWHDRAYNLAWEQENEEFLNDEGPAIWVPDSSVTKCCDCNRPFTFYRRRHHCRSCGLLFCEVCCSEFRIIPALKKEFGYSDPVRCCTNCVENIDHEHIIEEKNDLAFKKLNAINEEDENENTYKSIDDNDNDDDDDDYDDDYYKKRNSWMHSFRNNILSKRISKHNHTPKNKHRSLDLSNNIQQDGRYGSAQWLRDDIRYLMLKDDDDYISDEEIGLNIEKTEEGDIETDRGIFDLLNDSGSDDEENEDDDIDDLNNFNNNDNNKNINNQKDG